jgi:hypothetical protein
MGGFTYPAQVTVPSTYETTSTQVFCGSGATNEYSYTISSGTVISSTVGWVPVVGCLEVPPIPSPIVPRVKLEDAVVEPPAPQSPLRKFLGRFESRHTPTRNWSRR